MELYTLNRALKLWQTSNDAKSVGANKEMGDEYAEQLTSEYELTEEIVDDWWIEDI